MDFFQTYIPHEFSGEIFLGFSADISMFIVETYSCLTTIFPEFKDVFNEISIEDIIHIRHRGKIFDHQKNLNESINGFRFIYEQEHQFYIGSHKGALKQLKKFLQPDVSLTKYDNKIIMSSINTFFDFTKNEVNGVDFQNFSFIAGRYTSTLLDLFGMEFPKSENLLTGSIEMFDIKGQKLFSRIGFQKKNLNYAMALSLILIKNNYLKYIWSLTLPNTHTLFRIKFITAHHIAKNLSYIQGMIMKNEPSDFEKEILISLNSNDESKWLRKQSALRNLLTHYMVDKNREHEVTQGMSRIDTIEMVSKNLSFNEINDLLNAYIENISVVLEKAFKINENTFSLNKVHI